MCCCGIRTPQSHGETGNNVLEAHYECIFVPFVKGKSTKWKGSRKELTGVNLNAKRRENQEGRQMDLRNAQGESAKDTIRDDTSGLGKV